MKIEQYRDWVNTLFDRWPLILAGGQIIFSSIFFPAFLILTPILLYLFFKIQEAYFSLKRIKREESIEGKVKCVTLNPLISLSPDKLTVKIAPSFINNFYNFLCLQVDSIKLTIKNRTTDKLYDESLKKELDNKKIYLHPRIPTNHSPVSLEIEHKDEDTLEGHLDISYKYGLSKEKLFFSESLKLGLIFTKNTDKEKGKNLGTSYNLNLYVVDYKQNNLKKTTKNLNLI